MEPITIFACKNDTPRQCETVYLNINTQLPVEKPCYEFALDGFNQVSAELLMRHINKLLDDSVEQAHREAYNLGWADAKSKRRKKTHFSISFSERGIAW